MVFHTWHCVYIANDGYSVSHFYEGSEFYSVFSHSGRLNPHRQVKCSFETVICFQLMRACLNYTVNPLYANFVFLKMESNLSLFVSTSMCLHFIRRLFTSKSSVSTFILRSMSNSLVDRMLNTVLFTFCIIRQSIEHPERFFPFGRVLCVK